ncbi:hypothetical protein FB009_1456 [Sinorhizobium medicae]|nr:hypothetical protein FB009_1456 [Sinorhizobium medicae]
MTGRGRFRAWGVGSGEWGVGSGEWGVGSGEWGVGSGLACANCTTILYNGDISNNVQDMKFVKASGLTESEKVLADLCNGSFLQLWTYPNLFSKPGKELCDLLVVFGRYVLVFSDKNCTYGTAEDDELNWKRWYKKSIAHSAAQIESAITWISEQPDEIYLDAKCSQRLPIDLPDPKEAIFHRICVALGASAITREKFGRPSLRIEPAIKDGKKPLTIGRLSHARGWVHVFDEESLPVVVKQLSTASDFVAYLNARSKLLGDGVFVSAEAETDLLARYLWHNRSFPNETEQYVIEPDLWPKVSADVNFRAGQKEDQVSYFWDHLIERVTGRFIDGTLETGNELTVPEYESMARILAGESRFSRRVLAKLIIDRANRAKDAAIGTLLPSCQSDVTYVLYIGQGAAPSRYDHYRKDRAMTLRARCIAAKAVLPEKRFIVGVGLDAAGSKGSSEDFVLIDTLEWSDEVLKKAEDLRRDLGYFIEGRAVLAQFVEAEYPGSDISVDYRA